MKKLFFVFLIALAFQGCSDSTNPSNTIFNPPSSTKPVFPMPGYNARNTSNPYCINVTINPVQSGVADWSYNFQGNYFSDGSEFCVDSKSNVYYIAQPDLRGGFYKFSQNGDVIWKIDSLIQFNFCGISLSADESRVYVVAGKYNSNDSLFCIDSAGKKIWSLETYTNSKPLIGKEGDLYTFLNGKLTAISKDGVIRWQNITIAGMEGKYQMAIDKEDNLFVAGGNYVVSKVDSRGNVIWNYNAGNYIHGVVIDGYGNIYFNRSDQKLFCLNPDGQFKWMKTGPSSYSYPVITSDNRILIPGYKNIIGYDTSGAQVWKSDSLNYTAEYLLLDDYDNIFYLSDAVSSNIIICAVTSAGRLWWQYISSISGVLPPPVLLPAGKLLFAPKRAWKIQAIR